MRTARDAAALEFADFLKGAEPEWDADGESRGLLAAFRADYDGEGESPNERLAGYLAALRGGGEGNRHVREVGATLVNMAPDADIGGAPVPYSARNNYWRNPVIPLAGGEGGWVVARGEKIGVDELRELNVVGLEWALPDPTDDLNLWEKPEAGDMIRAKAIMEAKYHDEIFDRLALDLLGCDKRINVIRAQLTSYGKTALFDCLALAFPGMVSTAKKSELEGVSGRFNSLVNSLATTLWLVIDETDKLRAVLTAAQYMDLTDIRLRLERKGFDPYEIQRIGTMWLMGGGWPRVDTSAQGASSRFRWAWDYGKDRDGEPKAVEEMTLADGAIMRSEPAARLLRGRLLSRARDLAKGLPGEHGYTRNLGDIPLLNARAALAGGVGRPEPSGNALGDFIQSGLGEDYRALAAAFVPVAPSGSVSADSATADDVKAALVDAGVDVPNGGAMRALMNRFSPGAERKRKLIDGARPWRWDGVNKKPEEHET